MILAGILAAAPSAAAISAFQEEDVRISTIGSDSLNVLPGGVVTIVYSIKAEKGMASQVLTPVFDLPSGWGIVIGNTGLTLKESDPTVRFVTYRIPKSALSGRYSVEMSLMNADQKSVSTHRTTVDIEKVYSVVFENNAFEDYIPAGKSMLTSFHLSNNGNTPVSVALSALGRRYTQVDLSKEIVQLAPGESRNIEGTIHTDAHLDHVIEVGVRFEARILEDESLTIYRTVSFEVIPIYSRVRPKTDQIPISLSLETVGDENGFTPQAKISGSVQALGGAIAINAVLAEQRRDKFFATDQYLSVQYKRDDLTVKLGDHAQNLSPMTMTGEQGVGAAVNLTAGKWDIKSSVQRTRFSLPVQNRAGLSVGRALSETSFVSANLLRRNGLYDGSVLTLRSVSKPFGPTSKFDMECGLDSQSALNDPSCAVLLSKSATRWTLRMRGNLTSKTFPGASAGNKQISEVGSYRISRSFRVDNSIQLMSRDLGQGYARKNLQLKAGLNYSNRINTGTLFAAIHGIRSKTSYESLFERVEREEYKLKLSAGYQLRPLGFTASLEQGTASGTDQDGSSAFHRINSTVRVNIRSGWSVNGSFDTSSGNLSSLRGPQVSTMYGLGTTFALPYGVAFSATAFASSVTTSIEQQYASLRTRVSKTFRSGHLLRLQGQFNKSSGRLDVRSSDYSLTYSLPLYVPFGNGNADDTILKGQVIDQDTGAPVADALIFLGENLSITDKKGRFAIPRKLDRTEYLRLDQRSIGYDRISTIPLPLEVTPTDYQGSELVLMLSASASLSGRIDVFTFPGGQEQLLGASQSELKVSGGLFGAVVQLSNEIHRFRTRTGRDGQFVFGQLPEGQYTVEVIKSNLKGHQRIKGGSVNVIVEAGRDNSVVFEVVPVKKQLRIIKMSELSLDVTTPDSKTIAVPSRSIIPETTQALKSGSVSEPLESGSSIGAAPSSKPSGNWLNLMGMTAKDLLKEEHRGAAIIPFYVSVTPSLSESSYVTPVYMFMLILSILYFLVSVELFIRNFIEDRNTVILSMEMPSWIWAYRQTTIYVILIVSALSYFGPLGGFSIALGLAGVSISIESREQYKNLAAILVLLIKSQVREGAWIAYRDGVGQVVSVTIQTVTLKMHNGQIVELSPYALLQVSATRWKPSEVRNETLKICVSRMSNLRSIRHTTTRQLSNYAPMGTADHTHIAFQDLDSTRTIVQIEAVIDGNRFTKAEIDAALRHELQAHGIELISEELRTAPTIQAVETKAVDDSSGVIKNADSDYPALRLVKSDDKKVA